MKPDSKLSGHPAKGSSQLSPTSILRLSSEQNSEISPERVHYEPEIASELHYGLKELLANERERLMLGLTPNEEAMLRSIRTRSELPLSKDSFIDVLIAYRRHKREE